MKENSEFVANHINLFFQNTVAVVVTYNRKELLRENIESLLAQKPFAPHIIIVDNHSTDHTREFIEDYIHNNDIEYFDTGSNLGGAGGFSFGIKIAAEKKYDYIWVMDDDCIPRGDALYAFFIADQSLQGQYGFLSSRVLWKDGSPCVMNMQRDTLTHTLEEFSPGLNRVVMASFVSLFLPCKTVLELGLPIKEFFIWTDDWEYTRRISRKHACYAVAESVVIHKSQKNIGANIATDAFERLDRYEYLYRNDVYLYRREGLRGFIYESIRLTAHCLRIFLKAPDHKLQRIRQIFIGTFQGFHFHPEIEFIHK